MAQKTSKTPTHNGVRSPMGGFTPPMKTPKLDMSPGNTISNPSKGIPLRTPMPGKGNVGGKS